MVMKICIANRCTDTGLKLFFSIEKWKMDSTILQILFALQII